MAYTVNLYTFSKKKNSTAQPAGTGTEFNCKIKDGSGILNPTLILDFRNVLVQPQSLNYVYISEFSRYYYITDWSYISGLWECSLVVDVLASWKSAIGSYTGYVLRASSASNGNIKDTFYPAKTNPTHSVKVISLGWQDELSNGRYVVGIVSGSNSNTGSVSYYVMTTVQFNAFCDAVYANTNDWLNTASITDISTDLLKVLANPFEYIVSVMWFPFTVPTTGTALTSIPLGWWTIPVGASRLYSEAVVFFDYTVTPDAHPQAATRGAYLNSAPYTTLTLDFQPFGLIPLDASIICGNSITLNVYVDYISGDACLHIVVGNSATIIYSAVTHVGVSIQISGRQPTHASMIAGVASSFASGLGSGAGNGLLGDIGHVIDTMGSALFNKPSISETVGSISNAAANGLQRLASIGGNGSRAQILEDAYLAQDYLLLTDENLSHFGRPLYENKQISALSGYIQMGESDISFPGLDDEITRVAAYLQSGFFYE